MVDKGFGDNPLTPTFRQVPTNMAGRNDLIREMARAFDAQTRAPELTMLISGARGSGKTALLSTISDEADQRGWVCVNTVSAPGMLEDVLVQTVDKSRHLIDTESARTRLTELGIGQIVNVAWEHADETQANWRLKMQKLIEELNGAGIGLLIAVDEVDVSVDEMVTLASVYQLFVRENRKVSLIMAGLPSRRQRAISASRSFAARNSDASDASPTQRSQTPCVRRSIRADARLATKRSPSPSTLPTDFLS